MRQYILLIIALCLHIAVRGQTIASLDDIDLSGLPQPTTAKALRYWFDDDANSVVTVAKTSGTFTINTASLIDGLHTIHYQVIGEDNTPYCISSGIFMKMTDNAGAGTITATKLMYWFDDETDVKQVNMTGGIQMLDASVLTEGVHTIHYQALCSNGDITPAKSSIFMRMNVDTETATAKSLRYWFDDESSVTETAISSGVQMIDASRLLDGLHTVHYQIVDSKDMAGIPVSSVFMKMNATASTQAKQLRYWFDDDAATVQVVSVSKGTQTLNVSSLLTGLHTLNYQLIDSEGKLGVPVTRMFFKDFDRQIAEGENRITKYQYWLNTNSATMQTVELSNASNPYQLITLLPMQKEPIHSDCFQFEVTDGVPTIYAKNVFHVRFHDAAGYFADSDKPFVDYSVSQQVVPVGELQHTQTFARVAGNAIQWYSLNVERGDTVAFKTSQACSVQLFSPSGEEVYSASGSTSVSFGGCHTWENGTYYLAVHDVTGSKSQMSLDYMHMEKYDVVRQDVSVVGNGGCSTITFDGNGFKDLYAVELTDGNGHTIEHVYIGHESDATTSVTFDFTDAALGKYDAIFRFADEDKVFKNIVTVEEARDIELATTVTYPSTFLRGTSTTYTISIKNNGNMTAYSVPIYAYISSETLKGISHINVKGIKLKSLYDYIENKDSLDTKTMAEIKSMCDNMGYDHYFNKFATTDEQTGDSIIVRSGFFTIDVPPNTTNTITIEIQSTEKIEVWLTIPKEWHTIILDEEMIAKARIKKSATDWLCCYHERLECIGTIIVDVADIVGMLPIPQAKVATVVSCVTGAINQTIKSTANVLCNEENAKKSFYDKIKSIADGISVTGTILTCASGLVKADQLKELLSCLSLSGDALTHPFAAVDCITAWSKKKPNCPPDPPGGGSSNPVNSLDPNEIFGYSAESGSLAVKDGLRDVYYTIQFENDTTFATASAHDIYLTDTLDTKKFDLSTFAPTRVKIGSKSAELTGEPNSVTTVDMRPEINAIAQVESSVDQKKGIVSFHISSLDPMTMEPTKYLMDGVLPVNYDGSGLGEVSFDIQLRDGLKNGTEIPNRAGIVFDNNDVIMTPTWTNIVDRIPPVSRAESASYVNDSTVAVSINASDNLSGPWRYDVYVQYDSGAWFLAAENVPMDSAAHVRTYKGITHRLYTVCTDEAGNVERKQQKSELSIQVSGGVVTAVDTLPEKEGEEETESGDVYDLQGRKSNEAQAGKGIIIKNRKKVAKF